MPGDLTQWQVLQVYDLYILASMACQRGAATERQGDRFGPGEQAEASSRVWGL